MLDPFWAEEAPFDLFHLHFGFDARSPQELRRLVEILRRREKPFVYTVHDLRNPHHADRSLHDAQLDVLVPAADRLITLTPGAAEEIRARWDREALVVPHPHVVDLAQMSIAQDCRARRSRRAFRVGLHVRSLRANMDPMAVLPALVEVVAELDGAVLQVDCHRDVMEPGRHDDPVLATYLRRAAAAGRLDLRVHEPFTDAELISSLASLDVSVLPYRFGTHSGWLEACRDVGTTVVAPSCGYFAEQGPTLGYRLDEDRYDEDLLRRAIRLAHQERPQLGAGIDERRRQRLEVAAAHEAIYADLLG